MFRRLRRFLTRSLHQTHGAANGLFWLITKGPKHYSTKLGEMHAEIKKDAAEISEANERILWTTVGQALTAWAAMEETLVAMVTLLLRTETDKAGIIMYSIINFNVWLSVISELFALDPDLKSLQPKWNKISARIRKIKDTRDRIAHESSHKDSATFGVLKPSQFDFRAKTKLFKPLARHEILDFSDSVAKIAKDTLTLCQAMRAALDTSVDKYPEPTPDHSPESGSR